MKTEFSKIRSLSQMGRLGKFIPNPISNSISATNNGQTSRDNHSTTGPIHPTYQTSSTNYMTHHEEVPLSSKNKGIEEKEIQNNISESMLDSISENRRNRGVESSKRRLWLASWNVADNDFAEDPMDIDNSPLYAARDYNNKESIIDYFKVDDLKPLELDCNNKLENCPLAAPTSITKNLKRSRTALDNLNAEDELGEPLSKRIKLPLDIICNNSTTTIQEPSPAGSMKIIGMILGRSMKELNIYAEFSFGSTFYNVILVSIWAEEKLLDSNKFTSSSSLKNSYSSRSYFWGKSNGLNINHTTYHKVKTLEPKFCKTNSRQEQANNITIPTLQKFKFRSRQINLSATKDKRSRHDAELKLGVYYGGPCKKHKQIENTRTMEIPSKLLISKITISISQKINT